MNDEKIPVHQWTNSAGEVLILKCVDHNGQGYGGFQYPLTVGSLVEAPDWDPANKCGGGLHGWAWGIGIGGGKPPDWSEIWLVIGCVPTDVVHVTAYGHKDKARAGVIRYVSLPGEWWKATEYILSGQIAWVQHNASGSASSTGASGSASSTGAASAAIVTGLNGRAKAGIHSSISLAWYNTTDNRIEMRCREVGVGDGSDGGLKSDIWYCLNELGEFVEEVSV